MEGWVKLHRKILEHWVWNDDEPYNKRDAWIYLILMANHNGKKVLIDKELVLVNRGEFITSEVKLANEWGWGRDKVRNFLQLLEEDKMIIKKSTTRYTSVTIVNYEFFQSEPTTNNTAIRQDTIQVSDTNKNVKNVKNVSNTRKIVEAQPASTLSDHTKIMTVYHDRFLSRFGEKPVIDGGKDGKIIKTLLSTYGFEKLKGLLEQFMETNDKYLVEERGLTIGTFKTQINSLISKNKSRVIPIDNARERGERLQREL
jgi:hypothetical protein